jgi:4-aminobutyrate aminotransferase / (S)-3-amino-2-methylpropionate transaminase / 5-aminovalerate transaminase
MASYQRKYSLVPREVKRVETEHRRIVTRLPVPESLPLFEKLERFEPSSMQGQPPIVIDRTEGWHVHDRWGNMWLDWSSGVLISNIGNSNPVIIDALKAMLDRPLLSTYVFAHEKRAELVELLVGLAPSAGYKVFLLSTGSEATENCIKLAKTYGLQKHGPERRYFVTFQNAFHGRTMGSQLAGGNANQKRWMGKLDDSFVQVPFPDGFKNPDTRFALFLETLEKKGIAASQICGVMSESFQGVGPDFMPVEYARSLEAWCRENDILLIMDEVQAGFGRTGKWFAFQNYGITPDLIACGKGISSSLALSAVIGRTDVMELYPPGSMTSTHSGSPLPVAAAVANIIELKNGRYLQNALALDTVLRDALLALQAKHPREAGCVHSKGLVAGIQIVKPGTTEPDPAAALAINEACFDRGLLMFAPVGIAGECIKIAPALDISRAALAEGLAVLGEAMEEALR